MSEEIKDILNKFDKVLENYELDKKFKQFSVDSICHLFPYEMLTIKNTIKDLQQKVEQLENKNFNIRENIHLERISLPPELTKDKDFMELYDIPSYKDLQQKVEQLENIRKEAIEELSYMSTDAYVEDYDIREKHYNLLMNILNKGDNK